MKKITSILVAALFLWPNIAAGLQVNNTTLRPPMSCNPSLKPTQILHAPARDNIPSGCEGLAGILKQIIDNYTLALSQQTLEEEIKYRRLAKEGLTQLREAVSLAKERAELSDDGKVWLLMQLLKFSEAEDPDFLTVLASVMFTVDYNFPIAYLTGERPIPDSSRFTYYLFLAVERFGRTLKSRSPEFSAFIAGKLQERLRKSQWPAVLTDEDINEAMKTGTHAQLICALLEAQESNYYLNTFPAVRDAFRLYYPESSAADFENKLQEAFTRTIEAFAGVPRQLFLPRFAEHWTAYDMPLIIPLRHQQTISQPSFVYLITLLANPSPQKTDRVCEIGVGSGWQTALLAKLTERVVAVDTYPDLVRDAAEAARRLELDNIDFFVGDGSQGLPEQRPFDIIVVSAGGTEAAALELEKQLKPGGRLIMPILSSEPNRNNPYDLMLIVRTTSGITRLAISTSAWVPLVGAKGQGNIGIENGAHLGKPVRLEEYLQVENNIVISKQAFQGL